MKKNEMGSINPQGYSGKRKTGTYGYSFKDAKCTMRGEDLQAGRIRTRTDKEERKKKRQELGTGSERVDPRSVLRRSRRVGISSNAHDPPRLSLWKDQFPLREDLGQPNLPLVVVVDDLFDELVHAYRSLETRFLVPGVDVKLNLREDA